MLITDRQRCEDCQWIGRTPAKNATLILWLSYGVAAVGVIIADSFLPRVHLLERVATTATLVIVFSLVAVVYIVPLVLSRCPRCRGKRIVRFG